MAKDIYYRHEKVILSGVMVSVLAIGPKVCSFKAGRGRWILKGNKNPQQAFLWKGSKVKILRHVINPFEV
jgi:hypothetical protein